MSQKKDKDRDELLQSVTRWRRKKKPPTQCLGECVGDYLAIKKRALEKNTTVVDVWEEILPVELALRSCIGTISGGVLQIQVEPGPYMHEMQLLSGELLKHLQDRCPRAGIRKIRLKPRKV